MIIRGEPLGKMFPIGNKPTVIGRSAECSIQFGGDNISRRHCQVWRTDDGFWVSDLDSTNNTLVNNEEVQYCQLFDNDRISIGDIVLKFVITDQIEQEYHSTLFNHATKDPLTGTHNRRLFLQNLKSEIDACVKFQQPLSLIMCDIDHFKKINDEHTHMVGDHALIAVTETLQLCLRPPQSLARLGGEEFATILPAMDARQARSLAEQMRESVANRTLKSESEDIVVTISLGVAEWHPSLKKPSDLIKAADTALIEAKNTGRNKVVVAEPLDN